MSIDVRMCLAADTSFAACALLGLRGGLIVFAPLATNAREGPHVGIPKRSFQHRFEKLQLFRAAPQSVWQVLHVRLIASPRRAG